MKNTLITLGVIVIIIIGVVLFIAKGKKAEAPEVNTETSTVGDQTPIPVPEPIPAKVDAKVGAYIPPATSAVKEFTVTAQNFSFTPSLITVKKGDKVKITFKNVDGFHDFKLDEFNVSAPQSKSPSTTVLEFTADKTGSFQYYCSVGTHRAMGMWGTLKVE